MRPLIDVDNLSYSKEKLIYYSQTIIYTRFLIAFLFLIYAFYLLTLKDGHIGLLLIVPLIILLVYRPIKLMKKINEIQFRINSEGIQYRNEKLISWKNIENERVHTVKAGKSTTDFLIYYIIDQDKVINCDISDLNTDAEELRHTLKIHRNRYLRENNI